MYDVLGFQRGLTAGFDLARCQIVDAYTIKKQYMLQHRLILRPAWESGVGDLSTLSGQLL